MSYCHDIHLAKDFDRIAFAAATRDVRTLISRSEVKVVGPASRPMSFPIVEEDRIAFNGVNQNCVCGESEPEDRSLCSLECRRNFRWESDAGASFIVDVRSEAYLNSDPFRKDVYWFYCKTWHKPYDEVVKMSMMALKHHLGDFITLDSKGNWAYHWGAGHELPGQAQTRIPGGAVAIYEHVFPDRAPVQNILNSESIGF